MMFLLLHATLATAVIVLCFVMFLVYVQASANPQRFDEIVSFFSVNCMTFFGLPSLDCKTCEKPVEVENAGEQVLGGAGKLHHNGSSVNRETRP